MAQIIVPDYQGAPVPIQENGDREAFTTRDIEGAPYTWPAYSVENDPIMIRANEAYDLAETADGKADTAQSAADEAHLLATEGLKPLVPVGGTIEGMSPEEAEQVNLGTRVITSDGRVWYFKYDQAVVAVDPLDPVNYVEGADTTPEWAVIANKPAELDTVPGNVALLNRTVYGQAGVVAGSLILTDDGDTNLLTLGFIDGDTLSIARTAAPYAGGIPSDLETIAGHVITSESTVASAADDLLAQTTEARMFTSGAPGDQVVRFGVNVARPNGYAYILFRESFGIEAGITEFGMPAPTVISSSGGLVTKVATLGQYAENIPANPATLTGSVAVSAGDTLASIGFSDGDAFTFRATNNGGGPFFGTDFTFSVSSAATETVGYAISIINGMSEVEGFKPELSLNGDGFLVAVNVGSNGGLKMFAFKGFPFDAITQFGIPAFMDPGGTARGAPAYDFTTTAEHVEATERFPEPRPYQLPAASPRTTVDEQLGLLKQTQDLNRAIFKGVRMANTFTGDGVFAMRFANVTFSAGQTYPFISCFVGATRITSIVQDGDDMVVNGVNYDPVTGNPIPANSVFGFLFIGQLFDDGSFG